MNFKSPHFNLKIQRAKKRRFQDQLIMGRKPTFVQKRSFFSLTHLNMSLFFLSMERENFFILEMKDDLAAGKLDEHSAKVRLLPTSSETLGQSNYSMMPFLSAKCQ